MLNARDVSLDFNIELNRRVNDPWPIIVQETLCHFFLFVFETDL